MKSISEDRDFALAGWKFQFSNLLFEKTKNLHFNWAKIDWNLVEKYFESNRTPEVAVGKYLDHLDSLEN